MTVKVIDARAASICTHCLWRIVGLVVVLSLSLALVFASLANAREPVAIPFQAKVGTTFKVTVGIEERRLKDGQLDVHVKRTSLYDGRVETATASGYRIAWTLRSFDADILHDAVGNQEFVVAGTRSLSLALKGRPIVFETNRAGSPVRVAGWDKLKVEIGKVMQSTLEDVLVKSLKARTPNLPESRVSELAKQQADLMTRTTILRQDARSAVGLFQETVTLAAVQGSALAAGTPTVIEDRTTGALINGTVKHTTTFTLAAYDKVAGTARITWSTIFDDAELRAAAAALARQQVGRAVAQISDEAKKAELLSKLEEQIKTLTVKRSDEGSGTVDLSTGWAHKVVNDTLIETSQIGQPTSRQETTLTITVAR